MDGLYQESDEQQSPRHLRSMAIMLDPTTAYYMLLMVRW